MSSKKILSKLRSLVIENKDNRKEIDSLFDKLRKEDKHEQDLKMMKRIKMEYVGFKI